MGLLSNRRTAEYDEPFGHVKRNDFSQSGVWGGGRFDLFVLPLAPQAHFLGLRSFLMSLFGSLEPILHALEMAQGSNVFFFRFDLYVLFSLKLLRWLEYQLTHVV